MAQQIFFVTESYIKINTPTTANINISEVLPFIKYASEAWTRDTLGTYFYTDLLTKYNAQTLSADETTLVSHIQPAIAWRACADAVLSLSFQLKNKGVQSQSGDFSQSPELKAIMYLTGDYTKKAEFYENYLWEYLQDNKTLFTNFTSDANRDSTLKLSLKNNSDDKFNNQIFFI